MSHNEEMEKLPLSSPGSEKEDESDPVVSLNDPFLEIVIPEGEPTLFTAVRLGDTDMIDRQLRQELDLNMKAEGEACKIKNQSMAHRVSSTHYAVLHLATLHSSKQVIEKLLDHGADIDVLDEQHRTPLHFAVVANRTPVVRFLISRGANLDIQSSSGRTPLLEAVINESYTIAEILIKSGANLELADTKGTAVLHQLCFSRNPNLYLIELVLKNKGNPNVTNLKGGTPLMFASSMKKYFSVKMVELLFKYGADINQTDKQGRAAIHFVVEMKTNSQAVDNVLTYLIRHGASTHIVDRNGVSLLDMAMKNTSLPTIRVLLLIDNPRDVEKMMNYPQMTYVFTLLPDFKQWVENELYNPRPLMRLCRGTIRACLSPNNLTRVSELDIPRQLQNFLLGYDILK